MHSKKLTTLLVFAIIVMAFLTLSVATSNTTQAGDLVVHNEGTPFVQLKIDGDFAVDPTKVEDGKHSVELVHRGFPVVGTVSYGDVSKPIDSRKGAVIVIGKGDLVITLSRFFIPESHAAVKTSFRGHTCIIGIPRPGLGDSIGVDLHSRLVLGKPHPKWESPNYPLAAVYEGDESISRRLAEFVVKKRADRRNGNVRMDGWPTGTPGQDDPHVTVDFPCGLDGHILQEIQAELAKEGAAKELAGIIADGVNRIKFMKTSIAKQAQAALMLRNAGWPHIKPDSKLTPNAANFAGQLEKIALGQLKEPERAALKKALEARP